jgi:hypothetical protein
MSEQLVALEPDPNCTFCKGTGVCDSGGTMPWGEGIDVRCNCTFNPQEPNDILKSV